MHNEIRSKAINYLYNNSVQIDSGCREWTGPLTADGYGQIGPTPIVNAFAIKGAHRLMVHLVHGHQFTSRNQSVMHSCHNRRCVNPAHLSVGTPAQNMADAARRGSMARKLTADDVVEIRTLAKSVTYDSLARRYDVHPMTIYKVASRRTWKHIP